LKNFYFSFVRWQHTVMWRDLAMRRRLLTILLIVLLALLLALLFFFLQSGSGKVSYAHLFGVSSSSYSYEISLR